MDYIELKIPISLFFCSSIVVMIYALLLEWESRLGLISSGLCLMSYTESVKGCFCSCNPSFWRNRLGLTRIFVTVYPSGSKCVTQGPREEIRILYFVSWNILIGLKVETSLSLNVWNTWFTTYHQSPYLIRNQCLCLNLN